MERAWSKVALRHHPWGWMSRIGMRTLAGLAVSKCALAAEGCAPAAPRLLTFCCNCFTVKPHDGATAVEPPGTMYPGPRSRSAISGADGEIGSRFPRCTPPLCGERQAARLHVAGAGAGRARRPSGNGAISSESCDLRGEVVRRGPNDDLDDAARTHHAEGAGRSQSLLINLRLIGYLDAQTRDAGLEIGDVLLAAETGDDV